MQQQQEFLNLISSLIGDDQKDKINEVSNILAQYIKSEISFEDASIRFANIFGSDELFKKLDELLKKINNQCPMPPVHNPISQYGQIPKFPPCSGFRRKARPWSQEENKRLLEAIESNGTDNWALIASIVGGDRTRSQCSQRWNRVLNPKIRKENWSREEEQKLINAVNMYGIKAWTRVAAEMGNRSDVQCRFRYNFLLKKSVENNSEIEPISASQTLLNQNSNNNGLNPYPFGIPESLQLEEIMPNQNDSKV